MRPYCLPFVSFFTTSPQFSISDIARLRTTSSNTQSSLHLEPVIHNPLGLSVKHDKVVKRGIERGNKSFVAYPRFNNELKKSHAG